MKVTTETLLEMRAAGMSTYAIARETGLAQSGVYARLKRAGMPKVIHQTHRAQKDHDPVEIDETRYRIVHPTVAALFGCVGSMSEMKVTIGRRW